MIDPTMLVSLLAPILLLAMFDRVLRWVFARHRTPTVAEPSAPAGEVVSSRTAAPAEAAMRDDERRVA